MFSTRYSDLAQGQLEILRHITQIFFSQVRPGGATTLSYALANHNIEENGHLNRNFRRLPCSTLPISPHQAFLHLHKTLKI